MSDIEPRLVAVRGPLKGSILVLPDGDYTVGRQGSNNLYLEDHAVSRQHCIIKRAGGICTVNDLESRNGHVCKRHGGYAAEARPRRRDSDSALLSFVPGNERYGGR